MMLRSRCCRECGQEFETASTDALFCSSPCRKAFNNRRMIRGAELYDLYMAHRFERDAAKQAGVFQAINRLASNFREQDKRERDGRKSWQPFARVFDLKPHLASIRLGHMRAGR